MKKQISHITWSCCLFLTASSVFVNDAFAQTAAYSRTLTIDKRNMIGIMYNIGTSEPPTVYSVGNTGDPFDDVSNRRIGWGALTNGWAGLIAQFQSDISKGIRFIELDAPFGRWGWYLTDSGEPQCKTELSPGVKASGVRCRGKVEAYQISAWHELQDIYQAWLGQVPPIISTWSQWSAFNQSLPSGVTVQVHTGSPHNDYELNKLATQLTSQGVSQPLMHQQYWDMLWSYYKPYFDVGFRVIVFDNSAGNGATHVATKRALEVLRNPSLRECGGLDQVLCGSLGSASVQVRVEAVPDETYQLPYDYWVRNDVSYRPGQQCPNELCTGMATRFIRFGDETAQSLLDQVHAVLSDGHIALLSSGDRKTLGFSTMDELVSRLNVSIPLRIDLRTGNPGASTYQIVTQPSYGTLTKNPSYPYFYKYKPNLPLVATDSFTYTVTTAAGVSAPGTITINIVGGTGVTTTSSTPGQTSSTPTTFASAGQSSSAEYVPSAVSSSKRQRQVVQQVIDDHTTQPPEPTMSVSESVSVAPVAVAPAVTPDAAPIVAPAPPSVTEEVAEAPWSPWTTVESMPLLLFTLVFLSALLLRPPPTTYAYGMLIGATLANVILATQAVVHPWALAVQPLLPYFSIPVDGLMRFAPSAFLAWPHEVKFIFAHTLLYGTVIGILGNTKIRNGFPWFMLSFAVALSLWDSPTLAGVRGWLQGLIG